MLPNVAMGTGIFERRIYHWRDYQTVECLRRCSVVPILVDTNRHRTLSSNRIKTRRRQTVAIGLNRHDCLNRMACARPPGALLGVMRGNCTGTVANGQIESGINPPLSAHTALPGLEIFEHGLSSHFHCTPI